jgi:protein-disulfide isomerase
MRLVCFAFIFVGLLFSADWQSATDLPGVDFTGLTAPQKNAALKLMRDLGCTCGCAMKVAQCRIEDPACGYSKGISTIVLKGFHDGKTTDEVQKLVASSAVGRPRQAPKVLEDPVRIATTGSPATGPTNAKVTLVEFSDFECPFCAKAAAEVRNVLNAYPNDVRLIYKQFPLPMHPHAQTAALASLAADEQGKFWDLYYKMFANYRQLSQENILKWAAELGVNVDKFKADMQSGKNQATVKKDLEDGELAGVSGTPTFFVNGKRYNGPVDLASLKPILDQEIKGSPTASR